MTPVFVTVQYYCNWSYSENTVYDLLKHLGIDKIVNFMTLGPGVLVLGRGYIVHIGKRFLKILSSTPEH